MVSLQGEAVMKNKTEIYVSTCKGRKFYPFVEKPDFDIDEIAQGLATLRRWHGQWKPEVEFYSVAQHSVYVARLCSPQAKFWGLMHDAPEWLLGDLAAPIKPEFPDFNFQEDVLAAKLRRHFGIPFNEDIEAEVKAADRYVALREADALLVDPSIVNGRNVVPLTTKPVTIRPLSIRMARANFKLMFKVLNDATRQAV